jgi:antirestriction protein ArdC
MSEGSISDQRWMTYKQAAAVDGQVRKGAGTSEMEVCRGTG